MLPSTPSSCLYAPLTSFDWNDAELRQIGTCSIDTTCTIWNIEKEVVDTQLIAHDKEVYDIAWGGPGVFVSVSADGSVRVFYMDIIVVNLQLYSLPISEKQPLIY